MSEQLAPNNVEAEQSVLGSILVDQGQMANIELELDDFFSESHRFIYKAMLDLYKEGGGIDQVTVAHELHKDGKLEAIGGAGYLSHLISIVPTSLHAPYYAKVVKDCSLNRRIIVGAEQIAQIGYKNEDPIESLATSQSILSALSRVMPCSELLTPPELADKANERYKMLRNIKPGFSTGFTSLDNKTGGLCKGDYIILASRPGVGKTTLALQIAQNLAAKLNVLFASLEMMPEAIIDKLVAGFIAKPTGIVRAGEYEDILLDEIILSLGKLAEMNLYLTHGPATTHSLRQLMERMKLSYGLDVAFIDYLQLFRDQYGSNANERIGYISGELAAMSKEFNIPLVVLSQLSRAPEGRMDRRPHLSDLRESGSLEQDADLIIFLYRDSYYDRQIDPDGAETELLISKDRLRGLSGKKIALYWDQEGEKYVSAQREITSDSKSHGPATKQMGLV